MTKSTYTKKAIAYKEHKRINDKNTCTNKAGIYERYIIP